MSSNISYRSIPSHSLSLSFPLSLVERFICHHFHHCGIVEKPPNCLFLRCLSYKEWQKQTLKSADKKCELFARVFPLRFPFFFLLSIILSFTKINWFFSRFSAAFFRHILNDVCSCECVSEFVEKSFLLRLLCLCVFLCVLCAAFHQFFVNSH